MKAAVHALILSKLDYCNSLLAGLPKYVIQKFQHIMNSAAYLISGTWKCDHITPVLEHRINYKLICLTFKALNGSAPTYLTDLLVKLHPFEAIQLSRSGTTDQPEGSDS